MTRLIPLLLAATLCVASAATLNVGPGQSYATVQSAVNAAQPGDVVLVAPGSYPEVVQAARAGTPDKPIVIDGQGTAKITQFVFRYPDIKLRRMQVAGLTGNFGDLVLVLRGAHRAVIEDCLLDAEKRPYIGGIKWTASRTKPFGSDSASDCVITGTKIQNVVGTTMLSMYGDRNRVEKNVFVEGWAVDFIRVWGRQGVIRNNKFANNYSESTTGNHPDFIQTFGNNGFGLEDLVVEWNTVDNIESGQLTQFSSDRMPESIHRVTFRNNVFSNVALQASCTIPEVQYINNVFYRCNYKNGGHPLVFGQRWYDVSLVASGGIQTGKRYRVEDNGLGGVVSYMGTSYADNKTFIGGTDPTYTRSASNVSVYLMQADKSDGSKVLNNVFLECGDVRNTVGWYSFDRELTGVLADYNYVAKAAFAKVRESTTKRAVGDPAGWDPNRWWENHGINGGDPGLTHIEGLDFTPLPSSPLIGAGQPVDGQPRNIGL